MCYCYARPTHEFLGFSAGLDFETKITVKEDAPELIRKQFLVPSWQPEAIHIGAVTDAYQPVERRLKLTRRCLEVFAEFRHPLGIVTKNALVSRDADLLAELAKHNTAAVYVSVTTLDAELARTMEPRASTPSARLRAIEELTRAGVPVGVMVAPVIPALTDHEAPAIIRAAADAGAVTACYVMLRLPHGVKELFSDWLDRHRNGGEKVLRRIRGARGGALNDARFGMRMSGEGPWAESFNQLFHITRQRLGLDRPFGPRSTEAFRRPVRQPTLF